MTAPKRRWFRFSLATLFVVVTIAALCSPALVTRYKEWQRRRDWDAIEDEIREGVRKGTIRATTGWDDESQKSVSDDESQYQPDADPPENPAPH